MAITISIAITSLLGRGVSVPPADAAYQGGNDKFQNGCEICAALMYLTVENVSVHGNLLPYLDPRPENWLWI